jgi:hypothetical protein
MNLNAEIAELSIFPAEGDRIHNDNPYFMGQLDVLNPSLWAKFVLNRLLQF